MHIEDFVEKLKLLAPSKDSLKKRNLPDDFINRFIQSYHCDAKSRINLDFYSNDVILKLLQYYDCSKVEIGIVTFASEINEEENFYQIGNVEQDILALNKTLLSIEVLDYANTNYIIWKCASSSSNFLDALLLCTEFFTLRVIDFSLGDDNKYLLERVNLCTEKAGGNQYRDFYKMLLGYFD